MAVGERTMNAESPRDRNLQSSGLIADAEMRKCIEEQQALARELVLLADEMRCFVEEVRALVVRSQTRAM
jgi:hypothetical protein